MPSQQTRTPDTQQASTPTTATTSSAAPVRQPAGNAAAVARAGIGGEGGQYLGGNVGEVLDWMWDGAKDMLGLDDGETADGVALAKQTADNLVNAHDKLGELADKARLVGLDDAAAHLEGAAGKLAKTAGLAEQLQGVIETGEHIELVERLLETTVAVVAVDLRQPGAAQCFDAWFLALGETGEAIADHGGSWGALLKPFATFVKMFGENNLFTLVRDAYGKPHGTSGAGGNAQAWREAME